MTKEFIIDFKDAKNQSDVFYRMYKSIDCFFGVSEGVMLENIEANWGGSWDAVSDDLSSLAFLGEDVDEINFRIRNIQDLKSIPSKGSEKTCYEMLNKVITDLSDANYRLDKITVTFSIDQNRQGGQ